jgi:hypothetical protein
VGARGTGAVRRRTQGSDEGAHRPAGGARARSTAYGVPRSAVGHPAHADQSAECQGGKFIGSEIPGDLRRQWIQGTARQPGQARRSKRLCAISPTRGSRAPTAGCSTARMRSARSPRCRSTPAQPKAGHPPRPRLPQGRRAGCRRDERLGEGVHDRCGADRRDRDRREHRDVSVVRAALLAPLPFADADRLVAIWEGYPPGQPRSAFVISGNLGQRDARARYDLPPAQIERYVAGFLAEVSSG